MHIKSIIANLETIPYLADCLRTHLDAAKEQLTSDCTSTPEDQRFLDDLDVHQDNLKQRYLRKCKKEQTMFILQQISTIRALCVATVGEVNMKTVKVENQLLALSGLSQAEGTVTESASSARGRKSPRTRTEDTAASNNASAEKRTRLPVAEAQKRYASLISNVADINEVLPDICSFNRDMKEAAAHKKLAIVAKTFNSFLSTSKVPAGGQGL
jgi:hypothetical protein